MAIATVDDIVSGLNASQDQNFLKVLSAAKSAGAFQSGWLATGFPAAGAAPPAYTAGAGYTCDKSTAGAMLYANAAVKNWFAQIQASSNVAGTLIIADRLWSCSGIPFGASTYNITTPGNLPARIIDNGAEVECWVEQFVAAGAASGTLTLNYLNANTGAAKAGVIPAVVSAPVAGQMQPFPLAAGDTGVRQITSVTNSATWTSGSFGLTLLKRLATIPLPIAGVGNVLDWAALGLPGILNDACLMFIFQATSTTAATILGNTEIIDK